MSCVVDIGRSVFGLGSITPLKELEFPILISLSAILYLSIIEELMSNSGCTFFAW